MTAPRNHEAGSYKGNSGDPQISSEKVEENQMGNQKPNIDGPKTNDKSQ